MPRQENDRFQEHDRAFDGRGNTGVIFQIRRKVDRKVFLKVRVTSGPLAGQEVWPNYPWAADLDWTSDGPSTVCHSCDRVFKGDAMASVRQVFCKSCDREDSERAARQAVDASPSHAFGGNRPRVFRRTATDDVEDLIAKAAKDNEHA